MLYILTTICSIRVLYTGVDTWPINPAWSPCIAVCVLFFCEAVSSGLPLLCRRGGGGVGVGGLGGGKGIQAVIFSDRYNVGDFCHEHSMFPILLLTFTQLQGPSIKGGKK